jgi:hypothetical protein
MEVGWDMKRPGKSKGETCQVWIAGTREKRDWLQAAAQDLVACRTGAAALGFYRNAKSRIAG